MYGRLLSVISPFYGPAKRWSQGRRDTLPLNPKLDVKGCIWIHCASLGEYEQAKPIIQLIQKHQPTQSITLSFYSPSGYDNFKDHSLVDCLTYVPIDLRSQMIPFIDTIQPSLVLIIKNEIWFNMLYIITSKKIPVYLVSSTLGSSSKILALAKFPFFNILKKIDGIFTQSKEDHIFLKSIGFRHTIHTGDTRIDRVVHIAKSKSQDSIVEQFIDDESSVFICGSTHPKDEKWLISILQKSEYKKIIIAPHHTDTPNIQRLQDLIGTDHRLYTSDVLKTDNRWLIVDMIGRLSQLYPYAEKAYVGGGFGSGVHNTLEPAIHGIPVAIGPNCDHFIEVRDLVSLDVITVVRNEQSLSSFVNEKLSNHQKQRIKKNSAQYFEENQGASNLVYQHLLNHNKNLAYSQIT